jgi:membrane protein DedA with SNARE-associated domain
MHVLQFISNHGYLTVFVGLLLEYLGLPIPGELILVFFGALVYWGKLELWVVLAIGLAAVLLGNHFWYFAGRRGGRIWLRWLCRATLGSAQCISRTEHFFQRYGSASLLFAKFVPGLRTFAVPLAGMTGMSYQSFLLFDVLGSLLWLAGSTSLGILMAEHLGATVARIQRLGGALTLTLILVALVVLLLRLRKRLKYGEPMMNSKPRVQI